jgi:hypothetical protein
MNPGHILNRFASFIVLAYAGNLFSVMMSMPPMGKLSSWSFRPILLTFFSVMVPLTSMLLFTEHVGVKFAGFGGEQNSLASKWRVYSYFYLHGFLAAFIELASIGLSHASCSQTWDLSECMDTNSMDLFFGGLALANLAMGAIQFIGKGGHMPAPKVLLGVRVIFAVLHACGGPILRQIGSGYCQCVECMAYVSIINALQVLCGYVPWDSLLGSTSDDQDGEDGGGDDSLRSTAIPMRSSSTDSGKPSGNASSSSGGGGSAASSASGHTQPHASAPMWQRQGREGGALVDAPA